MIFIDDLVLAKFTYKYHTVGFLKSSLTITVFYLEKVYFILFILITDKF